MDLRSLRIEGILICFSGYLDILKQLLNYYEIILVGQTVFPSVL